jgi:hypothetical protein
MQGVQKKKLCNGIPNVIVRRVLRKRLYLMAYKLSIVQYLYVSQVLARKKCIYESCVDLTINSEVKGLNRSVFLRVLGGKILIFVTNFPYFGKKLWKAYPIALLYESTYPPLITSNSRADIYETSSLLNTNER